MPPRLNKRQQREQEELLALGGQSADVEVSNEEEVPHNSGGGFTALFTPGDDGDESGADEDASRPGKSKKSKKKKKKDVKSVPQDTTPKDQIPDTAPVAKKEKKQNKKGKAKKDNRDDLDKALDELSIKYPELRDVANSSRSDGTNTSSSKHTLASLLIVSLPHLDSEAEMKKFFGAKVISASKAESSSSNGPPRRQVGAQKSHLTRPQPSWWAAKQREGLSVRALTEDEVQNKTKLNGWDKTEIGEKYWTVEYSKKYKGVTLAFMKTVMSGDPEGFYRLLGKLPWHADTLLQLSEVFRHREEYSQAVDYVERALFTYERSFVGAFTFTSGSNRLDFDHVENRPFFLALHRQITDLQRRGCVRTAFEFARLLYSLDPWSDPHGALLHLEYLAIKAGMGQWLLDIWEFFDSRSPKDTSRLDPSILPGWAYSRALALRSKGDESSTEALKDAIISFPSVVPLLADKADISLSSDVRGHSSFRIYTDASGFGTDKSCLHLLSHIYAQRSFSLWKDPKVSSWFSDTVAAVFPTIKSNASPTKRHKDFLAVYKSNTACHSVYRHVTVLESTLRRLFPFIPHHILHGKQFACDPLPPPARTTEYDEAFFKGAEDIFSARNKTRRERAAEERMLERLIPDPLFRDQLQALFNANPRFLERFPGGVVQFAQMLGELPADAVEDILAVEALQGEQFQDGGMPGQMPDGPLMIADFSDDEEDPEDPEEEEEEEEDAEVAPLPVRLIRNFMNRFWGTSGGNSADTDSSEDEDRPPLDNSGVD